MLKRKLLKRVLPMILSISMVFGSMPETVFAAEYEERTITQETFPEEDEAVSERSENLEDTPASTGGGVYRGGRKRSAGDRNSRYRCSNR